MPSSHRSMPTSSARITTLQSKGFWYGGAGGGGAAGPGGRSIRGAGWQSNAFMNRIGGAVSCGGGGGGGDAVAGGGGENDVSIRLISSFFQPHTAANSRSASWSSPS